MEDKVRNTTPMQFARGGYIVLSALLCLLGLTLILVPDFSVALAGKLLGALMMVFGLVKIVGYWSKDLYRLAFQYDFAFGILMIPLGLYALCHPERTISFFCIILGIVVLADGLFKLQIALDSRVFGIGKWWLILVLALLAGVLGCVLIFHPNGSAKAVSVLVGFALLGEGTLNLSVALCAVKIIKYQRADEALPPRVSLPKFPE
ncbi:MAG: DUF308 domain-containing protein [Oscillospiraceae bacterium]|nr:DUF308 domain-containing protein [Oscillospiraceae bacterium]